MRMIVISEPVLSFNVHADYFGDPTDTQAMTLGRTIAWLQPTHLLGLWGVLPYGECTIFMLRRN